MTVYVIHSVLDDLTAAKQFGDFKFITDRYVFGDELIDVPVSAGSSEYQMPTDKLHMMTLVVKHFNPDKDYLLIAGDHLQLLQMASLLGQRFGTFMVLRYDRKIKDYIPVRLAATIAPIEPDVFVSTSHRR